jgi:hypothetical protein
MVLAGISILSWIPRLAAAAEPADTEKSPEQEEADAKDLAKAVQNPVADLISVPFQNNTTYNVGPNDRAANTLNIQPVIPLHLSENWLLVSRIIVPISYQPFLDSTTGGTSGVGDANPTFFLAPANTKTFMWGVGPAFLLPTATQTTLGTGKWSVGPSAVGLMQTKHWTVGALANQLWSFAGQRDDDPVLRELQPRPRLVPVQLADPDVQLEGERRQRMGRSVRRRHREDLQARQATAQRTVAGLLQPARRQRDRDRELAASDAGGVPFPNREAKGTT